MIVAVVPPRIRNVITEVRVPVKKWTFSFRLRNLVGFVNVNIRSGSGTSYFSSGLIVFSLSDLPRYGLLAPAGQIAPAGLNSQSGQNEQSSLVQMRSEVTPCLYSMFSIGPLHTTHAFEFSCFHIIFSLAIYGRLHTVFFGMGFRVIFYCLPQCKEKFCNQGKQKMTSKP